VVSCWRYVNKSLGFPNNSVGFPNEFSGAFGNLGNLKLVDFSPPGSQAFKVNSSDLVSSRNRDASLYSAGNLDFTSEAGPWALYRRSQKLSSSQLY